MTELDKAANEYANSIAQHDHNKVFSIYDFKAGANWRYEQFEKERLKHCDEQTAEQAQIDVLEEFLPKAATDLDILHTFSQVKEANGWVAEKKNMGLFVKAIKAALPNADGKLVAQVVQNQLA